MSDGDGDDQRGEVEHLSRGQDYIESIARMLGDLQGTRTVIHELIQNADDAPGATKMRFTVTDASLEIRNDGQFEKCQDVATAECEWLADRQHRCDFHSFRTVGSGDKRTRLGTTGAFGIGFTAVYQLTDRPELIASGEHWVVNEMAARDDRIERRRVDQGPPGTTFRLPWAVTQSAFRTRLRQQPITPKAIDTFTAQLREFVPQAMPFLKRISSIEIEGDGSVTRVELRRTPDKLTIASTDGYEQTWVLLAGTFEAAARQLKSDHEKLIETDRSPAVSIAIPIGPQAGAGSLYATLPTEESAHMPLLINADFYPASDRKRIRFEDGPQAEWNRAAIASAADVVASNLSRLPAEVGDSRVAQLLLAARELEARAASDETDASFAAFWDEITTRLDTSAIVPALEGGYGTPRQVRLWNDEAELAAAPVLHGLGVELVAEPVKDDWYRLRSARVGIENLNLGHVVDALARRGLTGRWSQDEVPERLSRSALTDLWGLIDVLLSIKDRSNELSRAALGTCAIAPGWDGAVWPLNAVYQLDQSVQDLLDDLGVDAVFLDASRLGAGFPRLLTEIDQASPMQVLDLVEAALGPQCSATDLTRSQLLAWFFEHRVEFDDDLAPRRISELPIFPTASGPRPLSELALPGNFRDELGLATIVQLDDIDEMRTFFEALGAKQLSLATYCTDFLAPAIEGEELSELKREKAVRLLATRLSEVRDQQGVRSALRPLHLVQCADGEWRAGSDVYLRGDLAMLVGDAVPVATLPVIDKTAHRDLFEWLGAATAPRPRDVEARCQELARGPVQHRAIAEAIITYLGKRYAGDSETTKVDFASLRQIAWLPVEGDRSRGYRPDHVHLRFRKPLLATQAKFIDIAPTVERSTAEFLRWLGLGQEPKPEQVVAHLLASADENRPVGEDMWQYLNLHADDPALDSLHGKRCGVLLAAPWPARATRCRGGPNPGPCGRRVARHCRETWWRVGPVDRGRHPRRAVLLAPALSLFVRRLGTHGGHRRSQRRRSGPRRHELASNPERGVLPGLADACGTFRPGRRRETDRTAGRHVGGACTRRCPESKRCGHHADCRAVPSRTWWCPAGATRWSTSAPGSCLGRGAPTVDRPARPTNRR